MKNTTRIIRCAKELIMKRQRADKEVVKELYNYFEENGYTKENGYSCDKCIFKKIDNLHCETPIRTLDTTVFCCDLVKFLHQRDEFNNK